MKKIILLTAVLFSFQSAVLAQDIRIGARGGLNFANLNGDFENGKARTSIHLGGVAEIPVSDIILIQPELLYSSMGSKADNSDNDVVKMNYISIPVLAKYFIQDGLSVEAGPQFGLLLSAKTDVDGEQEDIKDITKSGDIGFLFGATYEIDQGAFFGLRYYFGSNINSIENSSQVVKHGVFQLTLGYFFHKL